VKSKVLFGVVAAALLLVLPLLGVDDYYLHLLIMGGIFFLLSAGMNLLLAAGQLNLGHTAFFGIGAYASGLLSLHFGLSPVFTLPAAALVSARGWLLASRQARGAYFVLHRSRGDPLVATTDGLTQGHGLAAWPFNLGLSVLRSREAGLLLPDGGPCGRGAVGDRAAPALARGARAPRRAREREPGRVLGDKRLPPHHAGDGASGSGRRRRRLHGTHHLSSPALRFRTRSPWPSWSWQASGTVLVRWARSFTSPELGGWRLYRMLSTARSSSSW
jgi:hypothetical protein